MQYSQIYIVLTPFHLNQIQILHNSKKLSMPERNLIFYKEDAVNLSLLETYFNSMNCKFIPIYNYPITAGKILKKPLQEIKVIRKIIASSQTQIKQYIKKSFKYDLIIGSEKELFTQLLIQVMRKNQNINKLIAIEEGSGFYREKTAKDYILKFLYFFLTPILIGIHYEYFSVLGSSREIDIVYARFPELIKHKNKSTAYLQLSKVNKIIDFNLSQAKKIIFFTAPFSERGKMSLSREIELVTWVNEFCKLNELLLIIKQHPRESEIKFIGIPGLSILPKGISAEELNSFEYKIILNFGSSLVLDLYEKGYPLSSVITFNNALRNSTIYHIFKETKIISMNCKKNELFHFLNGINKQ